MDVKRVGDDLLLSVKGTEDSLKITYQYWSEKYRVETFEFADGTIAEFDTANNCFNILVQGSDFDEMVQSEAEVLDEIYDESVSDELTTDAADVLISELSDSSSVNEDNDNISDMTDVQAMLLADSMAVFADGNNVYDSVRETADASNTLGDLFVAAQI